MTFIENQPKRRSKKNKTSQNRPELLGPWTCRVNAPVSQRLAVKPLLQSLVPPGDTTSELWLDSSDPQSQARQEFPSLAFEALTSCVLCSLISKCFDILFTGEARKGHLTDSECEFHCSFEGKEVTPLTWHVDFSTQPGCQAKWCPHNCWLIVIIDKQRCLTNHIGRKHLEAPKTAIIFLYFFTFLQCFLFDISGYPWVDQGEHMWTSFINLCLMPWEHRPIQWLNKLSWNNKRVSESLKPSTKLL